MRPTLTVVAQTLVILMVAVAVAVVLAWATVGLDSADDYPQPRPVPGLNIITDGLVDAATAVSSASSSMATTTTTTTTVPAPAPAPPALQPAVTPPVGQGTEGAPSASPAPLPEPSASYPSQSWWDAISVCEGGGPGQWRTGWFGIEAGYPVGHLSYGEQLAMAQEIFNRAGPSAWGCWSAVGGPY